MVTCPCRSPIHTHLSAQDSASPSHMDDGTITSVSVMGPWANLKPLHPILVPCTVRQRTWVRGPGPQVLGQRSWVPWHGSHVLGHRIAKTSDCENHVGTHVNTFTFVTHVFKFGVAASIMYLNRSQTGYGTILQGLGADSYMK